MPTYEYECTKGHRFEVQQRITEEPLQRCQQCRSKVRRLISASAFILKGDGWYADGYASGSNRSSGSKKESDSGSDSDKSKNTGKEKPAADSKAASKGKSSPTSD